MIKEALKRESDKVAKAPLNDSLVDAWVFSGYENADAPTSIVGVNGNKLACHNFAWNSQGSGFKDGALWFDGVDDYLASTSLPVPSDYTLLVKREADWTAPELCVVSNNGSYSQRDGAFVFEYKANGSYFTYSLEQMLKMDAGQIPPLVSWQTTTSYNGTEIPGAGESAETGNPGLSVMCARNYYDSGYYGWARGKLYYLALYDRTLTEQEIKEEIIKLEYRWNLRKKMAGSGYVGVMKTNMEFVPYKTVIQGGIDKSEVVGLITKIVVGGTSRIILVSPDGALYGQFSNKEITLPDGVNAYNRFATAMEVDEDGEVNTQAFAPLLTDQPASVVNQCLNYTFKNGQHGYLMSLPDSVKLFAYNGGLTRLNNMLGAIGGGELIDSSKVHFTSSVNSIKDNGMIDMIWHASFAGTNANKNYYHKSYYVIPIAKLNI